MLETKAGKEPRRDRNQEASCSFATVPRSKLLQLLASPNHVASTLQSLVTQQQQLGSAPLKPCNANKCWTFSGFGQSCSTAVRVSLTYSPVNCWHQALNPHWLAASDLGKCRRPQDLAKCRRPTNLARRAIFGSTWEAWRGQCHDCSASVASNLMPRSSVGAEMSS